MDKELVEAIFIKVKQERDRQDNKWGEQNHANNEWLLVLTEEIGEVAKSILESKTNSVDDEELIQCIAVLFAWFESSTRNNLIERLKDGN